MSTDTWCSPFYTVDTVQRSMKNKCDHGLWSTIKELILLAHQWATGYFDSSGKMARATTNIEAI
jgi:hypothetical protein